MKTKKAFWVCLLAWIVSSAGMFVAMRNDGDSAAMFLFGGFYTLLFGALFFVFYLIVKFGAEGGRYFVNTRFCQKYDELKKEYGPILKETSVDWAVGRNRYTLSLSICRNVMFISDIEGRSFCVPYTQYAIRKESSWGFRDCLIIENAIPEEIAEKTICTTSIVLFSRSSHSEEFDLVMSLVEWARQRIQNTLSTL